MAEGTPGLLVFSALFVLVGIAGHVVGDTATVVLGLGGTGLCLTGFAVLNAVVRTGKSSRPRKHRVMAVRPEDGTLFEPSSPDHWTDGDALVSLLGGGPSYYFRRIQWEPAPRWKLWTRGRWARTGEVWEPESYSDFDIVAWDEATEEARQS